MRSEYTMAPNQMDDWKMICRTYASNVDAELLFINETSMGLQYKDGSFQHIYIDELVDLVK